ncbi:MAG: arginase family protein [Fibrobacteraceae bacterium]|nr:arginase family protein [Fibrobacteraceae bacterium]
MKKSLHILDFSGVYQEQTFLKNMAQQAPNTWLDCTDIQGTDCYCDSEAQEEISQRLNFIPIDSIHFIDSGNYHYLSKFFCDKIHQPFILVVFDNHPDTQSPQFDGILSCGGWVKEVMEKNPLMSQALLIGISDKLTNQVPDEILEKVLIIPQSKNEEPIPWEKMKENLPVYISIDKDVLSSEEAVTNWDQGTLSLKHLKQHIQKLLTTRTILGIDICGERAKDTHFTQAEKADLINNQLNKNLVEFIFSLTPKV